MKLEKLQQLSDAIRAAKRLMEDTKTANAVLAYQRLKAQRDSLRKTLPPLRVVD